MINSSRGQLRADPHLNNNELTRSPIMSTVIYHNHHIIPKYRCKEIGIDPDFEGNLIRLTQTEHAEAHIRRYKIYGRKEDLWAANMISSGKIWADFSGKNHPMYGRKHSQETRKKISESKKGKKQSLETIEKRVSKLRGKKHSPESIKNFSESQKGHTVSTETRKKIGDGNRGKKHTLEWKEGMSKRMSGKNNPNFGKVMSEETRKKISESKKGKNYIIKQKKRGL